MEYVRARGIAYKNEIPTIKKKKDIVLQPIYEAFTNAWEAIVEKYTVTNLNLGEIKVDFYVDKLLLQSDKEDYSFSQICVIDNGIGLNDINYGRLEELRNDSKNFSNKGTGRIQYIHFFKETVIDSVYEASPKEFRRRKVTLSKSDVFLRNNAILRLDCDERTDLKTSTTTVIFKQPLEKSEQLFFSRIDAQQMKLELIRHFLARFCDNVGVLPSILVRRFVDGTLEEEKKIIADDIPAPDKEESIRVSYSRYDSSNNKIVKTEDNERFLLRSFVQSKEALNKNVIYMVSKGEIASNLPLNNLLDTETINNNRYMFLLSGNYIDEHDSDDRGNIGLITAKAFKKQDENSLFPEMVVLLDDIKEETNKTIDRLYSEIQDKNIAKEKAIDELQQMFLLNPDTVSTLKTKIKNTDTDEEILHKIYKSDAEIKAKQDAGIKQQVEEIEALLPTDDDYQEKLKAKVDEFVRTIPLQNRTALSQYVARRKLVLVVFEKILNKELEKLRNGGRIDEDILHNLIFQQSSDSPNDSDLWLINEEYVYFKGFSEYRFVDMQYEGKKIFDKEFSEEDKRYLDSLKEKRLTKRPDILLFPEEGKCIIIEFKAPDVNVSEHLNQIDFYASLLRNYTIDKLQITTFYGYLIGESIEDRDVRGRVSRFEYSPRFNYWFRPSEKVIDFNNGNDGNIYTEIIKFSSLLERAKLRNKMFIDKLENGPK